jgi:tRNA (adenine37-N6)-methyltransferase
MMVLRKKDDPSKIGIAQCLDAFGMAHIDDDWLDSHPKLWKFYRQRRTFTSSTPSWLLWFRPPQECCCQQSSLRVCLASNPPVSESASLSFPSMPIITPIAMLRTCYTDKFGVPRQSGLVPGAWGIIEFEPAYRRAEAVRGIEEFSHLWLITQFHLVTEEPTSLTVRPPKLGGNERRGVFATRSPFRPNRLTLSVVKLDRVELEGPTAPRLFVSGVDLVDGTPVFDIKPYVRYADSIPEAHSGFADEAPPRVLVQWDCASQAPQEVRLIIDQSLSLQPQPAYHDDEAREYATEMAGWHVRWIMTTEGVRVKSCVPVTDES